MACRVVLVCLRIRNTENIGDKLVGIWLRGRYQLNHDMVRGVHSKVIQSNPTFILSDRVQVYLDHVTMLAGNATRVEKTKERSLD
jgi:hypothetical protein